MANKRIKELRDLSRDELTSKQRELEASLFQLRIRRTTGQLEDTSSVWRTRKDLARVKTLLTQSAEQAEGKR